MKIRWKNVKCAILFSAAAAFMTGMTAFAAEFTTPDSVLTLQIPDDDWEQVEDSENWATLTDGTDEITLLHCSNGEELPDITVAGNGYAQVCQNIISTENEVFIITGSVVDKKDFDEVYQAVWSARINQYDTKKAVKKSAIPGASSGTSKTAETADLSAPDSKKTVEALKLSMWVSSQQLNVRSQSSTEASILGTLAYMDGVEVTGIEKIGGKETGWYQINYNGSTGYVSAAYLTGTPSTAESLGYTLTSEQVTLYSEDGAAATYVNKATNGNWYDGSGRLYQANGDGSWLSPVNGRIWTETAPESPASQAGNQIQVTDADGLNSQTLYQMADGTWQNEAGGVYTSNDESTWEGPDGTIWSAK